MVKRMNEFKSVLKEATTELIEKKSRFISNVKPVNTESEALDFIKKVNNIHKDANHNVYAYVINSNVGIERASDDGEPQGTAGIPVLEVIKREHLTNICVVVTRYFGGILLGAGGLIRAYSASARNGIVEAQICTMALYSRISVKISYPYLGKIQNMVNSSENTIINVQYTEYVKLYIKVKANNLDNVINTLKEYTNGESEIECLGNFYDIT